MSDPPVNSFRNNDNNYLRTYQQLVDSEQLVASDNLFYQVIKHLSKKKEYTLIVVSEHIKLMCGNISFSISFNEDLSYKKASTQDKSEYNGYIVLNDKLYDTFDIHNDKIYSSVYLLFWDKLDMILNISMSIIARINDKCLMNSIQNISNKLDMFMESNKKIRKTTKKEETDVLTVRENNITTKEETKDNISVISDAEHSQKNISDEEKTTDDSVNADISIMDEIKEDLDNFDINKVIFDGYIDDNYDEYIKKEVSGVDNKQKIDKLAKAYLDYTFAIYKSDHTKNKDKIDEIDCRIEKKDDSGKIKYKYRIKKGKYDYEKFAICLKKYTAKELEDIGSIDDFVASLRNHVISVLKSNKSLVYFIKKYPKSSDFVFTADDKILKHHELQGKSYIKCLEKIMGSSKIYNAYAEYFDKPLINVITRLNVDYGNVL